MFNHKQENILSRYICAGLVSESLSTKVMNNLILEAAACKIVGDCHQAVATNVNRYFSSLQEMIPVLSSRILNNKLPIESKVPSKEDGTFRSQARRTLSEYNKKEAV